MSQDITDAEAISQAVTTRLTATAGDVAQALACINTAHVAFLGLVGGWLQDPYLAETGAGYDALDRLGHAAAGLRDVARIVENRQLREQAATLEDHP
jgi:hypothetical protein